MFQLKFELSSHHSIIKIRLVAHRKT